MPIFVKTPLRISLFGGGTDYREYFEREGGAVLGGTIDKFIYLVCLPMSPIAETRYRLTYSKVEAVDTLAEIQHPVIREVLKDEGYDVPFNLAVISDIPGGSGLGSSSAFTVGFINLVRHLKGIAPTKFDLARAAVRVESELLDERVGVQDQFHAAFGGLSLYEFRKDNTTISPIQITTAFRRRLNDSLVLVHTGRYRSASAILEEQIEQTKSGKVDPDLKAIKDLCYTAHRVLQSEDADTAIVEIGRMLSEGWLIKRSLSSSISNPHLDEIFETGMRLGAYGGKLAGAGGGGFFVFLAPPEAIVQMQSVFGAASVIKAEFQDEGSRLLKAF
jgi:D-glycero-alpha-D-manno-heptose-7-phosphate kinase